MFNDELEKLYRAEYNNYIKIAARRCGGLTNAEDVVQEAFFRALKYQDSIDPSNPAPLNNWFNRVLSNSIKDFQQDLRMQGLTKQVEDDDLEPYIEDYSTFDEDIETLIKHYNEKEEHLTVIRLFFIKNYSPREIVHVTNIPRHEVRNIIRNFKRWSIQELV